MCDSVTQVMIKITCPVCQAQDPYCQRCGGHGVVGVVKDMMEKPDRVPGGKSHAVVTDMMEKPDRAPGKNPMDAVNADLHRTPK